VTKLNIPLSRSYVVHTGLKVKDDIRPHSLKKYSIEHLILNHFN
jgi:hypothetical protein